MIDSPEGISEHELTALEAEGRDNVERLFNNSPTFEYGEILDKRGFRSRPEVFRIRFNSDDIYPKGLGSWPADPEQDEATYSFGPWIEKPSVGTELALKVQPLNNEGLRDERVALLRTNHLFKEDDKARPVRLYGYGIGSIDSGNRGKKSYLLQEIIPANFLPFREIRNAPEFLSPTQAFNLIISVTELINTLHQAGITHGDIEGPGFDQHVFFDPETDQLRIIDLHQYESTNAIEESRSSISLDRVGIDGAASIILDPHLHSEQALQLRDKIRTKISNEDFGNPTAEDDTDKYPSLPSGTQQFLDDLRDLQNTC